MLEVGELFKVFVNVSCTYCDCPIKKNGRIIKTLKSTKRNIEFDWLSVLKTVPRL